MSLREFAQRQAANGRPISVNEAKGRVISGLDILGGPLPDMINIKNAELRGVGEDNQAARR